MKFLLEDEEILQGQSDIFSYQDEQKAEEIYNKIKDKDNIESWFDALVPQSGKADSVAGELVRAMMRILYRDSNDGDRFFSGYGVETCGGSAQFIMDKTNDWIASKLQEIAEKDLKDDDYTDALNEVGLGLIQFLKNNKSLIGKLNEDDSRDWELDEEFIPKYDFDCEIPPYIQDLIDSGKYTEEDLESELYYWEVNGQLGYEADRISVDDYMIYIDGIPEDIYNELERNMYRWLEDLADDLEKEYGDLDDEEDEEDEDIDESLSKRRLKSNKFKKELDLDEALGLKEGISKNMTAEDIAKKHGMSVGDIKAQLAKGIKVEKEHTKDEKKAERIALDHLFEIPNYYNKLAKMEKSALKESADLIMRFINVTEDNLSDLYNNPNGNLYYHFDDEQEKGIYDLALDFDEEDLLNALDNGAKIVFITGRAQSSIKLDENLKEDTIKQNGKWVNKGKEGTHGTFRTKKAADAQRRAIWVNWDK